MQAGHYAIGHGAPDYNTLNSGGSDWAVKTVTETEYEPCACSPTGKIKRISLPHAPGGTPLWTTYTYDALGRTLSVALPNGSGVTTYEYNSDGTVKHTIDAKLQKTAFTYDSLKRVSSVKRYITSGGVFVEQPCQEVSFTYDSGAGANLAGRLAKATAKQCDANISEYNEVYSYEVSGLLQFRDANWVRNGSTLTRRVDPTWNQMGTLDAFGYGTPGSLYSYGYTYDNAWRPATMAGEGLTLVDSIVYSAAGAMKNFTRRESASVTVTNNYAFNALNQLTNQTIARNGTTVQNLSYTFSATQNNGQILSQTDALSAETVEYTYDALNRLATAETTGPQWGLQFSYDGFGNRTNQTVTKGSGPTHSVAIDAGTNRISTGGYLYDANGNMTQMPLMTMGYDVANRMVTSNHSGAGTQTYGYNQANQRIFVRNGSTVTYYLYGMGGERLIEFQETCTGGACSGYQENQRWIYFAGRKMFSMTGSTLKAIAPDRLASEAKHFPYGETDGTPPSDTKDYFATYRRDGTGLDYAWNRYYSPTMGRFTTADPYGGSQNPLNPESWNRYSYAGNDPVGKIDPAGLMLWIPIESYRWTGVLQYMSCLDSPVGTSSPWGWMCSGGMFIYSEEMISVLGPYYLQQSSAGAAGGGGSSSPFSGWGNLRSENSPRGDAIRKILNRIASMDISADCEKLLNLFGTSSAAMKSHAMNVKIFDSQGGSARWAELYRNSAAYNFVRTSPDGQMSIHQKMNANPNSIVRAAATLLGNEIFINDTHWSWSGRLAMHNLWTFMHEMIHNLTINTDPDLESIIDKLGLPSVGGRMFSENKITAALERKCQ